MTIDFEKLTPSDLREAAVVPQVLDNQWVPCNILAEMMKVGSRKKGLIDVKSDRHDYILKEWRRALVYGEQVVVNRAYILNNDVLADDYHNSIDRDYFKQLLRGKVIVPFFFDEDSPDQRPHFPIDQKRWNAWMDIVHDTYLSCARLDWGDQTDDFNRLSNTYHKYVQTINTHAKHFTNHFKIPESNIDAFKNHLKDIVLYAVNMERPINRNDLYEKFVCVDGSNTADGKYDRSKPFVNEVKQILDLKYNVNLPDALGRYALTPEDSPPRSVLGDLDDVVRSKLITENNVQDILYALRRLTFDQIARGLYLKSLGSLNLKDVIKVRDTEEWEAYRKSVNKLLHDPLNFPQSSAELYAKFEALNNTITRLRIENQKSKWEPWVKFMISVGTSALVLWLNPADPTAKILTILETGAVATGATPFLMRMTVTALTKTDADLDVSLDFMRGTVKNGRGVWNEIRGQLCSTPGFQLLQKAISEAQDANQSPAEAIEDRAPPAEAA